jgi:uncharacterized protein YodC (DUF2158 family)
MIDRKEVPQPAGIETREVPEPLGTSEMERDYHQMGRGITLGAVVQVIGEPTRMTVEEIAPDGVACVWFEGDTLKRGKFAIGALRVAPPLYERNEPKVPGYFLGSTDALSIARVIYEANRAYAVTIGDNSFGPFHEAPSWQISTILKGIDAFTSGDVSGPHESHESWLKEKVATGWRYGPVKDAEAKTHPCMVPYDELPASQRRKDHLFLAIVHALTKDIG